MNKTRNRLPPAIRKEAITALNHVVTEFHADIPAFMDILNSVFKVIIVHEDSVTGLKAVTVLKRLAARLGTQLGIDINPWQLCNRAWQFEWLQDPELSEQAMAEAGTMDMIIISAGARIELPICVRAWIESVLARKQDRRPIGLVALLDERRATPAALSHSIRYLQRLAEQNGVDFYCNLDHRSPPEKSRIESVLCRFEDDPALLEEAIPNNSGRRRWDIND